MNQKENELIELAHQLKVLETEVEKFRTDKKKIDAEIKRTTKTIEEAKDKIISYMFQNKKTELDLKVYKFFVRNTTAVDTEEFMKLVNEKIKIETEITDDLIQRLVELNAIKIETEIKPDKNMLKNLSKLRDIPGLKIEERKYIDIN